MKDNFARENGAAILILDYSSINMIDCLIYNNYAGSKGGGIYVSGYSIFVNIDTSSIFQNTVKSFGGGLYVEGGDVTVKNTLIYENTANSAVFNLTQNSSEACSTYGGCFFSGNYPKPYGLNEHCGFEALADGVLEVKSFSTEGNVDILEFNGVKYSIIDGPDGVSVSAGDILEWSTDDNLELEGFEICFEDPANGGGVYLTGELSSLSITNVSIERNKATRYGGGVFCDSGTTTFNSVLLNDNVASFDGSDIYFSGGILNAYDLTVPRIAQSNILGGSSIQAATCVSKCPAGYSGTCELSNDAANCYVNCNCAACVAGTYAPNSASTSIADCASCGAGTISASGAVSCTSCDYGRYASDSASEHEGGLYTTVISGATSCNDCPAGYFTDTVGAFSCRVCSNTYDSVAGSSSCELAEEGYYLDPKDTSTSLECPNHASCFGGSQIPVPKVNYWVDVSSNFKFADIMFPCSRLGCVGVEASNHSCWNQFLNVSDDFTATCNELQCGPGSYGPLCSSCLPDYIYRGEANDCVSCDGVSNFGEGIMAFLTCALFGYIYFKLFAGSSVLFRIDFVKTICQFFSSFESGALKVMWVTYQIIMSTRWNLDIKFSSPFSDMYQYLSIFSFDFLSIECFTSHSRYYKSVYLWSLLPIFICFVVILVFVLRYFILRHYDLFEYNKTTIMNQHIWFVLVLTYVILPATSMKQLQSLNCIEVNQNSYLRYDTSINCNSQTYVSFRAWVIFLFCCYQIIPIVWMVLLYQKRHLLRPYPNTLTSSSSSTSSLLPASAASNSSGLLQSFHSEVALSPEERQEEEELFLEQRDKNESLDALRFLFNDYKCNKWWFEVSDMYRRIIFIGVLPLTSSNPTTKASFGCILAILSVVYFREAEPYRVEQTNRLAYVAQFTILLTFYGALSIDSGVMLTFGLGNFGIAVFLFLTNLIIITSVIGLTWQRFHVVRKESRWKRALTDAEYQIVNEVMSMDDDPAYRSSRKEGEEFSSDIEGSISLVDLRSSMSTTTSTNSHETTAKTKKDKEVHAMKVLSQYLIHSEDIFMKKRLGAGAFGEVFTGTCMGEPVAIKTMLEVTEENVKEFRSEILLTATLRHPNIVNFVGACWGKELICMVLEWVSKGSLTDFLGKKSSMKHRWDDPLLRLTCDIARGMKYLHTRSYYDEQEKEVKECILHRDLKPDNVLVSEYIAGKISDFGTSRAKGVEDVIMTGVGTPLFVAPEVMRGEYYDEKADVYSFGMTLIVITIADPILKFIGERWRIDFDKKKIPTQPMRLIRPMTEDGWRPITTENPIPFAPSSIHSLLIRCCSHQVSERPSFETILDELMTKCKEEIDNKVWFRDHVLQAPPPPHTPDSSNSNVISNVLHL